MHFEFVAVQAAESVVWVVSGSVVAVVVQHTALFAAVVQVVEHRTLINVFQSMEALSAFKLVKTHFVSQ